MQRAAIKEQTDPETTVVDDHACKIYKLYIVYKSLVYSATVSKVNFESKHIRPKFIPQLLQGEMVAPNIKCETSWGLDCLKAVLTVSMEITIHKRNRKLFEYVVLHLARDESMSLNLDDMEKLQDLKDENTLLLASVSESKALVCDNLRKMVAYYKEQRSTRAKVQSETKDLLYENSILRRKKRKLDTMDNAYKLWSKVASHS